MQDTFQIEYKKKDQIRIKVYVYKKQSHNIINRYRMRKVTVCNMIKNLKV